MTVPLGPISDDDERDNSEVGITAAWHECLEWAERGDLTPLATMLRGETTLRDDQFVREFLADFLDGKIKRPRGKPVRKPTGSFWVDASGGVSWQDDRDRKRLEIRRWVAENRAVQGLAVFEAAARHFEMDEETVRNMLRRSSNAWKRSRST